MSNYAFVLDQNKRPLDPIHPAQARLLLTQKKAAVFRYYPFTIILTEAIEVEIVTSNLELKLDPGSKTTGIAILNGNKVIWGAELTHRGQAIKADLDSRRAIRRNRRNRKTRYRQARFLNRARPKGWLAPSLQHRVLTTMTWVKKLIRLAPISSIAQELVRFDLQQLEAPEISGVEYQQGTLYQYEVREYLLEKWNRTCGYCGVKNTPLEVEHIVPKSKGGSNRVSNLALACVPCNQTKGTQDIKDFLNSKPDILKKILTQAKRPLKDAAAVNSTRWALFNALKSTGLPVQTSSGGQTKFNRSRLGLEKRHYLDAAVLGNVESLEILTTQPLLIIAKGHGSRQMVQNDKYGFPRKGYKAKQKVLGWNTGDIVSVVLGKHSGVKNKPIKTVRFKGNFDIRLSECEKVISVSRNHLRVIHHKDGYNYKFG